MAVILFSFQSSATETLTGEEALAFLDEVAAKQSEQLKRLETYEIKCTLTFENSHPKYSPLETRKVHLKHGAEALWANYETSSFSSKDGSGEPSQRMQYLHIANDTLVGRSDSGHSSGNPTHGAFIWEHTSYKQKSKDGLGSLSSVLRLNDFRRYGYGDGNRPLAEISRWAREKKISLTVIKPAKGKDPNVYSVEVRNPDLGKKPFKVFAIDTSKSGIITDITEFYSENGVDWVEDGKIRVTPEEIEPGFWFPMTWEVIQYGSSGSAGPPFRYRKCETQFLKTNAKFEPDIATLTELKLVENAPVMYTNVKGEISQMLYRGGKLTPK
ncbi:MAG TPA: hypothetical protein PLJ47_06615, partial [Candidatus Hydrogenedentes bacterium]|nr:hypothetical protein [Candidatus Hydrogenedentota bacterium]